MPIESVIEIRRGLPTILMADDASLTGRFNVWLERRRAKRYHISGFGSPGDTIEWLVDSPTNGPYSVSALISARDLRLRLAASSDTL